jgi:high affinity sulfate transporter 1
LYATIIPLIVYSMLGPSRIMVIGPDSALAGIIAATILPLAAGQPDRAIALAAMLAMLSGGIFLLASLARFGFIADLLSKPIRNGYLNGIVITVLVSQVPKLFGLPASGESLVEKIVALVQNLAGGRANWMAFTIGIVGLMLILAYRRWLPRIPGAVIAVAGATAVVTLLDPATRATIPVIGALPQGLPSFHIPSVTLEDVRSLLPGALVITLVSFVETSILSRVFALRGGYDVDENQELIAFGAANIVTGLFSGFSISSSASRTPVAEAAGAKTQVTSLVGALCTGLLLIFAPALLQNLPGAALSAVVIAACLSMADVRSLAHFYRVRREEFVEAIVCFLGVAIFGVIQGIFLSVALALLAFIWRAWRPHDAVLGRVDGMKGYHDIKRHPEGKQIPGLVLFRWDAPLFFANAETFREHVLKAVADAPTPTIWVAVAAEPITDVDITGADMLAELDETLHKAGMDLCFAEMKGPVKDLLRRYDLFNKLGADLFFPTLGVAVDKYLQLHPVKWQDWEEQS